MTQTKEDFNLEVLYNCIKVKQGRNIITEIECKGVYKAFIADQFYLDALKEVSLQNTTFDLKTYIYIVAACSDGSIRIF